MPFVATDQFPDDEKMLQEGYWQNKKYFDADFHFEYNLTKINDLTKQTIADMVFEDAVGIHVRRGDVLKCS